MSWRHGGCTSSRENGDETKAMADQEKKTKEMLGGSVQTSSLCTLEFQSLSWTSNVTLSQTR